MPDGNWVSESGSRRATVRIRLVHLAGRDWTVREEPLPFADQHHGMSLIFESPNVIRRIRHYPPNWSELSDEELFALSLGT
jgi:hypothetical protein